MAVLTNIGRSDYPNHPTLPQVSVEERGVAVLAVSALIIGLLGMAYGICGFTSLAHTCHVFQPLCHMGYGGLSCIVISGGALSTVASVALVVVRKKVEQIPLPQHAVVQELDEIATKIQAVNSPHLEAVKKFISSGYASYLDYYGFYHHLACITEDVIHEDEKRASWVAFLKKIHGKQIRCQDGKKHAVIDCSVELGKIDKVPLNIEVEELDRNSHTLHEDLKAVHQICLNAFPLWSEAYSHVDTLKNYFFVPGSRPFVMRSSLDKKILGVIVIREHFLPPMKTLYFHTLARSAHAVKMRVVEKFAKQIDFSAYDYVWCEVLKDNLPAQSVYEKLGLKIVKEKVGCFEMGYRKGST
jgi:hypothetical protein